MPSTTKNMTGIIYHFLFWLVFYGIDYGLEQYQQLYSSTSIIRYLLGIILFYNLVNILKNSGLGKKTLFIVLSFMLFLLLSLLLKFETFSLAKEIGNQAFSTQILYIVDNFVHLFVLAYLYYLLKNLKEKQRQAIMLENQLHQLETEYLNSKIDSHFFLNSINFFYAYFLEKDEKLAKKLIKITDFVREKLS